LIGLTDDHGRSAAAEEGERKSDDQSADTAVIVGCLAGRLFLFRLFFLGHAESLFNQYCFFAVIRNITIMLGYMSIGKGLFPAVAVFGFLAQLACQLPDIVFAIRTFGAVIDEGDDLHIVF